MLEGVEFVVGIKLDSLVFQDVQDMFNDSSAWENIFLDWSNSWYITDNKVPKIYPTNSISIVAIKMTNNAAMAVDHFLAFKNSVIGSSKTNKKNAFISHRHTVFDSVINVPSA